MLIFSKILQSTVKLCTTFSSTLWAPVRPAAENKPDWCSRRLDPCVMGSEPLLRFFCPSPWTFSFSNFSRNPPVTTEHISPSHDQIFQAFPTIRREMVRLLTRCWFERLDKQHPLSWNGTSVMGISLNKGCNPKWFILFFPQWQLNLLAIWLVLNEVGEFKQ